MILRFLRDEAGSTAAEYALITVFLSLAILGGLTQVAGQMEFLWGDGGSDLRQASDSVD
jgi:Flp pilus assembly pilin Flp